MATINWANVDVVDSDNGAVLDTLGQMMRIAPGNMALLQDNTIEMADGMEMRVDDGVTIDWTGVRYAYDAANNTDHTTYSYELVGLDRITATDLREEAQNCPDAELAIVTFLDETGWVATQTGQVLYSAATGCGAMEMGGGAVWTDAGSLEDVIERWIVGDIRS